MAEGNKTEQPTPHKRQKAREKGQIARSRELMSSLATLMAVIVVALQFPTFAAGWRMFFRRVLDTAAHGELGMGSSLLVWSAYAIMASSALALALSWMMAMLAAVAQGGLVFAPAMLAPSVSRISPAKKMEQLFSLPAAGRMFKSLLPAAAIVYLTVAALTRDWGGVEHSAHFSVYGLASFTLNHLFEIAWKSALVLVVWAGADYFLEKQRLEGELRMSRQEVMEEYKETEGHPTVKGRIRRLQRQMRKRRMLEDVKRASVVITNPTEFAVALEYGPLMAAPTVVAKGRNLVARQIKEIARWQNIPMVENPPLAHALYRAVEVGQTIPSKLYAVVAGILAAIYRAQEHANARASQGAVQSQGGR